jgi:hypothetical protein
MRCSTSPVTNDKYRIIFDLNCLKSLVCKNFFIPTKRKIDQVDQLGQNESWKVLQGDPVAGEQKKQHLE